MKKIAILGSTGSIGSALIDILKKDSKKFKIELLTANKNYRKLLKQIIFFNVKNIIVTDLKTFDKIKKILKDKDINIYNNFNCINKIFKNKKIDYVMSAISGIDGLKPTLDIIKFTKLIAIANKEALICGWTIINKVLKKFKTQFVPVDSEHFSIWYALKNDNIKNIEKIFLTASGGPFLRLSLSKFKDIKIKQALNHPRWKMGKKISIDSATMMNKVFEVIEAKNIFNLSYDKISILIHPESYVHAILKFNNGLIKIIGHETSMKIPIFNTLYLDTQKTLKTKNLDIKKLNNLNLNSVEYNRYPAVKLLHNLPKASSLYETVLVSANDELVKLFLEGKIEFTDIFTQLSKLNKFNMYKKIKPNNVNEIIELNKYVRLKIATISV
jgi:1-deoxy-D-xylulose-5-phosphate reductoisomerase